ncbi:hypothetical protein [Micavibrio aeruginosavorus]|uniref:hypothetical protein n=1 Tax=Micavibrio aeruginosavorus TaxID=349221 RepID=UPI003F4A9C65
MRRIISRLMFVAVWGSGVFYHVGAAWAQFPQSYFDQDETACFGQGGDIVQYPSKMRVSLVKMIISGVDPSSIRFNPPETFDALSNQDRGIFHPNGGNVEYSNIAAENMQNGMPGVWFYSANISALNVGTDNSEIIAFLPGLKSDVCENLNAGLWGIKSKNGDGIPIVSKNLSPLYNDQIIDYSGMVYKFPSHSNGIVDAETLSEKPLGCFKNGDGAYVYYHVLYER